MPTSALPRRTQEERRSATRAALLDATVSCLVELGFARTTTTEVTRRAGVSMGALQHHFPGKADLLAAAVEHVLALRQIEFATAMSTLDEHADRVEAAVDLLWSAFSGPTFTAWLELWVASRTDPSLAALVVGLDNEFVHRSHDLYAQLFPPADYPGMAQFGLSFTFALLDGAALQQLVPGSQSGQPAVDALKAMAKLVLAAARPEGDRT